jgi:hypothetical protein
MSPTTTGEIAERDIVTAASTQVSCDLDGETIILNLLDGIYYGLDGVGARVWDLARESKSVAQIRDILLEEFQVEPEVCARELKALLEDLRGKSLVEVRNAPAT